MADRCFPIVGLIVALLLPSAALAQNCIGLPVAGEANELALARVKAEAKRANFVEPRGPKKPKCPDATPACRRAAFVTAGDEVLVAPGPTGFVCASFIKPDAKRAESSGFLPAEALEPVAPSAPAAADWAGQWQRGQDGRIAISQAGERLKLVGEASFGRSGPGRAAAASGEFEVVAEPRGALIAVGQGYSGAQAPAAAGSGCQLRLRLFGRYLAVEDNSLCGGIGVSFTGLYVKG